MVWKTIKLGDAATFINGYAFKPNDWSTIGLEIIRIQNLTKSSKEVNYYEGLIDEKYKITKGDLLISWSATLGIYEWIGKDSWLNQHIFKVVFNKKEFDKSFFRHLLSTIITKLDQEVHGSTMKHITKKRFDNLEIPLPDLSTQQKIANILDKADELRQYNKQLVEKYDALTQSLFLDMFGDPVKNEKGWRKVELVEVCNKITDGTHKTPNYISDGIIFLSAKNIKKFKLNNLAPKYISLEEHLDLKKRCNVERGDILITKSGSLGMAAIVEFEYEFSIFESLALIKQKRDIVNGIFLLYFLNTESTQQQYNNITKGVGVKHLHLTDLRKLKIILPSLELQNEFSNKIQIIETQREQAQDALEKSEALFQSLLQKAFKGELN